MKRLSEFLDENPDADVCEYHGILLADGEICLQCDRIYISAYEEATWD